LYLVCHITIQQYHDEEKPAVLLYQEQVRTEWMEVDTIADFGYEAEDAVMDTMILRAIADARQTDDPMLRQEALTWLWICCPDIADQLGLPTLQAHAEVPDLAAYSQRHTQL
jgi:hypothetical protein